MIVHNCSYHVHSLVRQRVHRRLSEPSEISRRKRRERYDGNIMWNNEKDGQYSAGGNGSMGKEKVEEGRGCSSTCSRKEQKSFSVDRPLAHRGDKKFSARQRGRAGKRVFPARCYRLVHLGGCASGQVWYWPTHPKTNEPLCFTIGKGRS